MSGRSASSPSSTEVERALTELLQAVLVDDGLVVEELRLIPAGKRRVLRVLVDRDPYAAGGATESGEPGVPDGPIDGLSLDEVAEVSRVVSARLDALSGEDDPLDGTTYTLEVSSPGIERPLTLPRHFRRNVGRLVDLRTVDGSDLRCRITAATADSVTVQTGVGPRQLAWTDIHRAKVQVEFRRAEQEA